METGRSAGNAHDGDQPSTLRRALVVGALALVALVTCPGSTERDPGDGANPFTDGGTLNCDPSLVPPGRSHP